MQTITAALGFLGIFVLLLVISVSPFLFVYTVYCLVVWEFYLLTSLLYTWLFSIIASLLLMVVSNIELKSKFKIK